jgi:hypothetical protein
MSRLSSASTQGEGEGWDVPLSYGWNLTPFAHMDSIRLLVPALDLSCKDKYCLPILTGGIQ